MGEPASGSFGMPGSRLAPMPFHPDPRIDVMLISSAYAQTSGGGSDFLLQLMPILLMFVIFYLLLLRPQQQRMKAHREMVANIRRGDTVVTSGGIIGKVTKVKDDGEIEVEIADNTRVRVIRSTVAEVRVKGEPVKETA
jgi:preprotein translocase subunit YajC